MEKELEEFINLKNERKNSAYTKLKLLIYGVQDAPKIFLKFQSNFKEEHYAYDNGNWGVDKKRLTPTEILLPGGIVSKLHIRPDSPITLKEENNKLFILLDGKYISEFKFLPRPNFWNYKTRNGTPTKNLAQMYGLNSLNFNIYSGCEKCSFKELIKQRKRWAKGFAQSLKLEKKKKCSDILLFMDFHIISYGLYSI